MTASDTLRMARELAERWSGALRLMSRWPDCMCPSCDAERARVS